MSSVTVADTAFSIAVVRAEEARFAEADRLFEDAWAPIFAAAGTHAAEATQRYLDMPFFRDGIRLRTRFIDDVVRDALRAGIDQLVILGAGFDARGMRLPEVTERAARVYEIDSPEQLDRKERILAGAGLRVPEHIAYLPFDFERRDLETDLPPELAAKGFRLGERAVFVWEGVIGYIDDDTIDRSLRFMAKAGGAGSRLAFTYGPFDPQSPADRTRRAGFRSCETFTGEDLWRRRWPTEPHPNASALLVAQAVV